MSKEVKIKTVEEVKYDVITYYTSEKNFYECFTNNIISTIAIYWKRDMFPYFWDFFGFNYNEEYFDEKRLLRHPNIVQGGLAIEFLQNYSGIKLEYEKNTITQKSKIFLRLCEELNKNMPVGLCIDYSLLP